MPDDDLEESIEGLWQNVFDAYDEKIAALTMPRRVKKAPLTPDAIKAKVARFVKAYRGEKGTGASTHLRTMAMLRLQAEP